MTTQPAESGPILICAATGIEARGCDAGIERAGASRHFEVLQTGIGLKAAESALRKRLAASHLPRPSQIVSSGTAGAKTVEIALGDWVLATAVTAMGREVLLTSGTFRPLLEQTALKWKSARCLSREAVSGATEDLGAYEPTIVDMESYALAQVAAEARIPFDIFRLISDTPELPIPQAVGTLAGIASAGGTRERAKRLWSGSLQVLTAPVELASFARRSMRIPASLADGWADLARSREG